MKSVSDYIPKDEETVMVQAKVRTTTHEKIKAILDKEGWTWHEFMNGLFLKYLDENKSRKGA